jgi:hypothetical protein
LSARGLGIEHGNTDDLGGEGPKAALLGDFSAAGGASDFVSDAFAFTEEVFLLGFVEAIERESGGFDVENEFGHCDAGFVAEEGNIEQEETEKGQEQLAAKERNEKKREFLSFAG